MTTTNGFLDYLCDQLADLGPVKSRRMFGGAGLYLDGVMFGLVADDVLYLKADETNAARFEAEGLAQFTYHGKSKLVQMSYWQVPDRLFDDHDEFVEWAVASVMVARAAKHNQKKPSPNGKLRSAKTHASAKRSKVPGGK